MKKIITFLIIITNIGLMAQTTYVPDDNFEQALIDLGYDSGPLDDFVPTANINTLNSLAVQNNNITDLTGIEDFVALQLLDFSNNQVTNLDLSTNTALIGVYANNNNLVILNLKTGNTTNFDEIITTNNPNLLCIEVDDAIYAIANLSDNIDTQTSYSEDCSGVQTYVPDDNFEQALIDLGYDSGTLNNYVPTNNINTVNGLNITNMGISDLTGIEDFTALTSLSCGNNQLTSINISNNSNLSTLLFPGNQLSNIDVSQNSNLLNINANFNSLSSIDVSQNTSLINLGLENNQITALNVNENISLFSLSCSGNQLTSLDLSLNNNLTNIICSLNNLTSLNLKNDNNANVMQFSAVGNPNLLCIEVDNISYSETNWINIDPQTVFSEDCSSSQTFIPDDNFEQALIDLGYDSGPLDDYVTTDNINTLTSLNIFNKNISDLTGIEDFSNLENLSCGSNTLETIDLSQNVNLIELECFNNVLTSLDISQNTNLTTLTCYGNQLTSLDISQNLLLSSLTCNNNQITILDTSTNAALVTLNIGGNNISNLDLNNNTLLERLECSLNQLSNLDVSSNTNLIELYCPSNMLTSLDVSQISTLSYLSIDGNQISSINLTQNPNLIALRCYNNTLSSLNLSTQENLEILSCYNNALTNLDVSNNSALISLRCNDNQLTELNVKNGNNTALSGSNFVTTNNLNLECVEVDDVSYSNSNWTQVDPQTNFSEDCSTLNLNNFDLENTVTIYPNPASNIVNIKTSNNTTIDTIELVNIVGKRVLMINSKTHIDVSTLVSGMYLLKIEIDNQTVIKKLVIN